VALPRTEYFQLKSGTSKVHCQSEKW